MIGDAIAVIGLLKDSLQWTELEPLQVDDKWLDLAKEKNVVRADGAYRWSDNDKVETRRLEDETLQDTAVKLRRLGAYVEEGSRRGSGPGLWRLWRGRRPVDNGLESRSWGG